jgi:hypothetical protein
MSVKDHCSISSNRVLSACWDERSKITATLPIEHPAPTPTSLQDTEGVSGLQDKFLAAVASAVCKGSYDPAGSWQACGVASDTLESHQI